MNKYLARLLLLGLVSLLGACATQPQLSSDQVLTQYPQVTRLEVALNAAKVEGAELLAPIGYRMTEQAFEASFNAAKDNNDAVVKSSTNAGFKQLDKLNNDLVTSRGLLAEVIKVRDRAYQAGADHLGDSAISDLDADFKQTAALIEQGNLEQAKKNRPELIAAYSTQELIALKRGTVDGVRAALQEARKHDVDDYAPMTLGHAVEEINLALSILDADRTQVDKASLHAEKARWLIQRSESVAETIRDFNRRDLSMEEVVLWHQAKLAMINEPFGGQLPFNESNENAVLTLRTNIMTTMTERDVARTDLTRTEDALKARLAASESKVSALMSVNQEEMENLRSQFEEDLAKSELARKALEEKEQSEQRKFEKIHDMFTPTEASVSRQRKNVLISAHGFKFFSGQSEIEAENFPLMNKIINAVRIFPEGHIEVSGHTDATGDDSTNQVLSRLRAEKVVKFLIEVGSIQPGFISFRGYGKTRPVASNDTREGRAENRRVEIRIINE